MGEISKATIKRKYDWFNPLFINFNEKSYEVKNFVLYDCVNGKVITETAQGWFCETPSLDRMEFNDMELRNKENLTASHPFFIRTRDILSSDNKTMAVVYIPADIEQWKLERVKGLEGTTNVFKVTDVVMVGGYNARVREFSNTITTPAYHKRNAIAKKCNIDSYTLNEILKALKDEGYDVNDIISE